VGGFTIKDTLVIPPHINVVMEGAVAYDGPHDRPAIIYGEPNTRTTPRKLRFNLTSVNQSNWENDDYVGLLIYNVQECHDFKIDSVRQFTTGVKFMGSGHGFVYNNIEIGYLYGNKYGVIATNESSGWFNENEVEMLSVMHFSGINRG